MPTQNPTAAGINARRPLSLAISIDGIKRLQIEAATITPSAKPESIF